MRAASRVTMTSKQTVQKFLRELAPLAIKYQDKMLRKLNCQLIQCDELETFIGSNRKTHKIDQARIASNGWGRAWSWLAFDPETRLIPSWHVGTRDGQAAKMLLHDLAGRLTSKRVQITTDSWKAYEGAIREAFGNLADYAKIKGKGRRGARLVQGAVAWADVSTSLLERLNFTIRQHNRRYTRRAGGFSKDLDCLRRSLGLWICYYNFCRVHPSLKKTPAEAAGAIDWKLQIADLVDLLIKEEAAVGVSGV